LTLQSTDIDDEVNFVVTGKELIRDDHGKGISAWFDDLAQLAIHQIYKMIAPGIGPIGAFATQDVHAG